MMADYDYRGKLRRTLGEEGPRIEINSLSAIAVSLKTHIGSYHPKGNEIKQMLTLAIEQLAANINALSCVKESVDWRKLSKFGWYTDYLYKELKTIAVRLSATKSRQNVEFTNNVSQDFRILTNWRVIRLIFEIILDNAFRVTANQDYNTEIIVSAHFDSTGTNCNICISNPGLMSTQKIELFEKRLPIIKSDGRYGKGLLIANYLLDVLDGNLRIEPKSEIKRTEVYITL